MIVASLGEKGGTGKTTLATNLAGMRAYHSDVVLIDADRQGTASIWMERRAEHLDLSLPSCVQSFGAGLSRTIRDMARRYNDVVVDVASGDNLELSQALASADAIMIPMQPAAADLWTFGQMDIRVEDAIAINDLLRAFAIINKASPNPRAGDVAAARSAMADAVAITVSEYTVCERVSIKRAIPQGRTVPEYRPIDARACAELEAVYKLVYGDEY